MGELDGLLLDRLDIEVDSYQPDPALLRTEDGPPIEQTLVSHLLKSNCLVTGQPDWGSVQIHYVGAPIEQEGLLRYLIGFREHNEFHEQCVERIFVDILRQCRPYKLSVYARYTRRGGLDINPWRSNFSSNRAPVQPAQRAPVGGLPRSAGDPVPILHSMEYVDNSAILALFMGELKNTPL